MLSDDAGPARGAGQAAGPPPPGDQRGHGPGGRAVRHAALRRRCRAGDLRTADVERGPAAPERAGSPLHRRLLPRPARRARPSGGPAPGRRADQPGADPVRHGRVDGDQRHGLGAAPKYRPAALPAFHGNTRVLARPWPARATAAAGGGTTGRRGSGCRPGEQARAMTRAPRITVFGTGYLGAAHAACLASLGLDVLGVDIDAARVGALAAGRLPFYEPGLEPLLHEGLRSGRLRFTTSYPAAAEFGDVHFICVGTPQRPGSPGADLSQFEACFAGLAPLLRRPCLVAGKSTVPPGTAAGYAQRLPLTAPAGPGAELAWNPEFLREGHAVADTLRPDRIVAGVWSGRAEMALREVYAEPLAAGVPFLVTDLATAELVKVAANAFLATKISFINAMAEVCEEAGADVTPLAEALGLDARIGRRFLSPGLGYGGGCLPKDIRGFRASAADLGVRSLESLLTTVDEINLGRRERVVALARQAAGGSLADRRVAVLGVAFKPNSDDVRDSPSLAVCDRLAAAGAVVSVHDPVAMPGAARKRPGLRYAPSVFEAAERADLVLHLTEWSDY